MMDVAEVFLFISGVLLFLIISNLFATVYFFTRKEDGKRNRLMLAGIFTFGFFVSFVMLFVITVGVVL